MRIVIHHNHPDNSGLSIEDWAQFAYPGLHAVWAHGHEGAVSRGELTDETRGAVARMSPEQTWHKIYSAAGRAVRRVHQLLSQEVMHGRLTPKQLDDYGPHLVNAILQAAGIVDYRSNIDLTDTLARLDLGEKLNGIAINAQREFFGSIPVFSLIRLGEPDILLSSSRQFVSQVLKRDTPAAAHFSNFVAADAAALAF
jgi:hypothetical protein